MKLFFLYGAPGTGKYTVAKELAKETGYTLLHNHIILNALSEIFGFNHPVRRKLEKEFRLRIIEEAAKADINLIVTGVIMRDNEAFYRNMLSIIEKSKGNYQIIYLTAPKDVLEKRTEDESRKVLNKISSKERFNEWVKQYPESFKENDFKNQITFDTSSNTPEEIINKILQNNLTT